MTTKSLRLAGATLFLGTVTLIRAAVAPAENLLPADTLAFITVPDCDTLRTTAKVSPQMMFWNDTAMKPFRDKFMGRLTEQFLTPLEKDLGIKTDDFVSLLQGQFTVGVTVNGSKGNDDVPPGFYGLWHDGHWIAGQFKFSSFPSGHAATAAGLVAAAWLIHRGWAMALMPYALLVIWSRMALQCHHLSDVLASTLLAILMAGWLKRWLLPSVEFQFGNLHRAWRKK